MDIDYDADLADKLTRNTELWAMLAPHAEAGARFELDFFFYADSRAGNQRVVEQLESLGYRVKTARRGTPFNRIWAIAGSTPAVPLSRASIDEWTASMVEVARAGAAQFDGWGTALPA
jgi:hypothetical protein